MCRPEPAVADSPYSGRGSKRLTRALSASRCQPPATVRDASRSAAVRGGPGALRRAPERCGDTGVKWASRRGCWGADEALPGSRPGRCGTGREGSAGARVGAVGTRTGVRGVRLAVRGAWGAWGGCGTSAPGASAVRSGSPGVRLRRGVRGRGGRGRTYGTGLAYGDGLSARLPRGGAGEAAGGWPARSSEEAAARKSVRPTDRRRGRDGGG